MSKKERGPDLDARLAEIEATLMTSAVAQIAVTMHYEGKRMGEWRRRGRSVEIAAWVCVLFMAGVFGLGFAAFVSLGQSGILR